MRKLNAFLLSLSASSLVLAAPLAALAQKGADPNLGHFYMARQQITITDDAPVVNNKTTQPGAQGAGSLPAGVPQGLPAARWTQYSPTDNPSLSTSLPKVTNGVPPKMPPQSAAGNKGKTGKLPGGGAAKQVVVKKAPVAEGYAPYKKFSPDGAVTGASESASNVRGDVLHWARRAHGM